MIHSGKLEDKRDAIIQKGIFQMFHEALRRHIVGGIEWLRLF